MSRNRAERRRQQREADRKCLTVADERRLDATRRLPNDFPTIARVLRNKKKQLSPKQLDELRSDVIKVTWEEAQPVLSVVRNSREFRRCQKQLAAHPGPKSRLAPDVLMAATIIAADDGSSWRSVVCQVVNGMDTRLWHQADMCDHQTREPVSFGIVARQLERLERLASDAPPNGRKTQ